MNVYWYIFHKKVIHLYHFQSREVCFEFFIKKISMNQMLVFRFINVLLLEYNSNISSFFSWSGHSGFCYMYIFLACCVDVVERERERGVWREPLSTQKSFIYLTSSLFSLVNRYLVFLYWTLYVKPPYCDVIILVLYFSVSSKENAFCCTTKNRNH